MLPLRWARGWQVASIILLVLVLVAGVAPVVWLWPDRGDVVRYFAHIDKWAHAVTFMFLALWFCGQYTRQAYWRIALGLLVYGIVIEAAQRMVGYRTADPFDVVANISGIGVGLTLGLLGAGGWSQWFERLVAGRRELD
ncbi:MAG: VanZ family protein [Pseudomonadota bacterium]